jgi:hypothetical protein
MFRQFSGTLSKLHCPAQKLGTLTQEVACESLILNTVQLPYPFKRVLFPTDETREMTDAAALT